MPCAPSETYLGDGVYATWDGYQIWLDTRAQSPVQKIALDSETYSALVLFVARVKEEANANSQG